MQKRGNGARSLIRLQELLPPNRRANRPTPLSLPRHCAQSSDGSSLGLLDKGGQSERSRALRSLAVVANRLGLLPSLLDNSGADGWGVVLNEDTHSMQNMNGL